jgi:hypothetical protein
MQKALAVAVCLGLLWWLWTSRGARRRWADPKFLAEATVAIPAEERKALATELRETMRQGGINAPLAVNAPYSNNAINVYITSASKRALTGCRPGDARYDADSDVLLLDENVVWPLSTSVQYAGVNIAGAGRGPREGMPKIWLHFAFLHELGHRALHRGIRARLRRDPPAVFEAEADAFALSALEKLAATGTYEHDAQRGVIHVPSTVPDADRPAAVMASLIQHLSLSLLFGGSHFSPFHADSAHEAFVARFRPHLIGSLARTTSQAGRASVLLSLAYLDRVEETGRGVIADIYSVEPVRSVMFSGDDLLVTVADQGKQEETHRIALGRLLASDRGARKILLPDEAERSASAARVERKPVLPAAVRDGDGWVLLDERGAVAARRSSDELRKDLQAQFALDEYQARNCSVVVTVRPPRVDVAFACTEAASVFSGPPDNLLFIGELDPKTLRITGIDSFLGPEPTPGEAQALLDMTVDGKREIYVIADRLADRHTHRFELRVSSLQPRGRVIVSRELVLDWIPTGANMYEWFRINHPAVIACREDGDGLATCTEFLDSIFSFDPRRRTLTTLFYPAGAKMAAGPHTQRAFYTEGGHKVFVVQASRSSSLAEQQSEATRGRHP